uniref:Formin-binding protein 1-like n=1 Tax=Sinocyclocheilus anshuiensis TaxID=1608454 RepID=A0A671RGD1_9TELE
MQSFISCFLILHRNLSKKYQPKKKEEDENKYTWCRAFHSTLNELNDYAGQHEVIAENMTSQIIAELTRYAQEIKTERKAHFHDGRKAQQQIEANWKQLELCKRKFERDCKEADRAQQYFEKLDADINVTKADVEKVRASLFRNTHTNSVCVCFEQKIQAMEEKRIERMGESLKTFAEVDRQILPIIGKCLDGITQAAESIEPKNDSSQVIESYKSGFEPPGDVEFEDYGQAMKRTVSETSLSNSRSDNKVDRSSKGKSKTLWPFIKKNKGSNPEDFSHLPPEQRRKKLQSKIDDINKDIQKEMDQRDALTKMKEVYIKNPQMGDPNSVDPRLAEIGHNIEKLQAEAQKFEGWLAEVEGRMPVKSDPPRRTSALYETQNIQPETAESGDEFDDADEEILPTIGTCKALYPFEGVNEGTISVTEGELLYVIEEDKGDGWTRVRRNEEEEGYVPSSYVEVFLDSNAKGAITYI